MTHERSREPVPPRTDDHGADQPQPDRPDGDRKAKPEEPNPLLREGADALDAADIEQPERQR